MNRRNVLVFHLGALGDFVLTWPLALALSRIYPQSRIVYVTAAGKGALAEEALGVESADIEGGWHHLYADAGQLPGGAAKLLAGAHSVYSFIAAEGDGWCGQVRRVAGEVDLCCLDSRPAVGGVHATEQVMGQLRSRPAVMESMRQMIGSICERGLGRRARQGGPVVIHPGSGSREKCWAPGRYVELGRRLRAAGWSVRVVVGEVEAERWGAGQMEAFGAVGEVVRPGDYVQLLRCLDEARVYVGNDSGPSHLAGVLGVPTVCLFGPTDAAVWRPLGPRVRVIGGGALEGIEVEQVERCVRELVSG